MFIYVLRLRFLSNWLIGSAVVVEDVSVLCVVLGIVVVRSLTGSSGLTSKGFLYTVKGCAGNGWFR